MGAEREHAADLAILHGLLDRLGDGDRWCMEVGAWDGQYLSATRALILERGFRAVLIEADERRFGDLDRLYAGRDDVIRVNRRAGWTSVDSLDAILADTPIPERFDLVVIDVDGFDYHLWAAMSRYRPKLVMIEFNGMIPNHVDFVQPVVKGLQHGSSVRSMIGLAGEKGYRLVACSDYNAWFADKPLAEAAGIEEATPTSREGALCALSFGADGSVVAHGVTQLPMHGVPLSTRRLQQLPWFLRRHPDSYGRVTWRLFRLLRWWRRQRRSQANARPAEGSPID